MIVALGFVAGCGGGAPVPVTPPTHVHDTEHTEPYHATEPAPVEEHKADGEE